MYQINRDLETILYENGASLVGFADLKPFARDGMDFGVSVAVALDPAVLRSISDGPTEAYYDAYFRINRQLDRIVTAGAEYLSEKGYRASAQTTDAVAETADYRTALPYKTVATRAGLGWIGKCALLVTKKYGSAIRLSSLLTDAPLQCADPVGDSRCGGCTACRDACPGRAVSGTAWHAGLDRNCFFDPLACRKAARKLAAERLRKEITLCGQCVFACPYTKGYLNRAALREDL